MRLDPAVREFVEAGRAERMAHLDVGGQRHYMRLLIDLNFLRFSRPGPAVHSVTDHGVAVDGGEIRCRVYRPGDHAGLPVHIALHGGGWWQGSVDDLICDAICRQRCVEANIVVVAVDYRLAPEHPFPTPLDDAYAAYAWVAEHAEEPRRRREEHLDWRLVRRRESRRGARDEAPRRALPPPTGVATPRGSRA